MEINPTFSSEFTKGCSVIPAKFTECMFRQAYSTSSSTGGTSGERSVAADTTPIKKKRVVKRVFIRERY